MFCTECGASNSDQAIYCSNCGTSLESSSSPVPNSNAQTSPQLTSEAVLPAGSGGFISKLICQSKYTTLRAKWFCETAEKIVNIFAWLAIAISLAFSLFLMAQGLDGVFVGLLNIASQLYVFLFFCIFLIFAKLILMAVGALIRITELLEMDKHS